MNALVDSKIFKTATPLFRTAAELGINPVEYAAMLRVLDGLEKDEFVHDDCNNPVTLNGFNMGVPSRVSSCGTACCIGGWVSVFMQGGKKNRAGKYIFSEEKTDNYVESKALSFSERFNTPQRKAVEDLFYPPNMVWEDIEPAQAARALRNYLTTGQPNWSST